MTSKIVDYDTAPDEIVRLAFELEKRLKWLRENLQKAAPAYPMTRSELSELHWDSVRKLTKTNLCHAMHYARSQFLPIGSNEAGYFYAIHPLELNVTVANLIDRASSLQRVIGWVKKTQERMRHKLNVGKQLTLFEPYAVRPLNQDMTNESGGEL